MTTCEKCGQKLSYNSKHQTCLPCRKAERRERLRCPLCGKDRSHMSGVEPGSICRDCRSARKTERLQREAKERALKEAAAVDWAAVEWVIQGRSAVLNAAERRLVIRAMAHKLVEPNDNPHAVTPGRITAEQLGERIGTTGSHVTHIRGRLPEATRQICPDCRGYCWVLADGTVEQHGNGFHNRCQPADEIADELYSWDEDLETSA